MRQKLKRALAIAGVLGVLAGFILSTYEVVRTWRTVSVLQRLGPADVAAVPELIITLDDRNPYIREAAAGAIGKIGSQAKDASPALIDALRDSYPMVRRRAAWALARLGPAADSVPPLIEALDDTDGEARRYAAFALMTQGKVAEPAIPKLIEKLDDPHMGYMAASALGEIGPPAKEAIPHLLTALRRERSLARLSYIQALGKFGSEAKQAVPDLLLFMQDSDAEVRKTTATALKSIGPVEIAK